MIQAETQSAFITGYCSSISSLCVSTLLSNNRLYRRTLRHILVAQTKFSEPCVLVRFLRRQQSFEILLWMSRCNISSEQRKFCYFSSLAKYVSSKLILGFVDIFQTIESDLCSLGYLKICRNCNNLKQFWFCNWWDCQICYCKRKI